MRAFGATWTTSKCVAGHVLNLVDRVHARLIDDVRIEGRRRDRGNDAPRDFHSAALRVDEPRFFRIEFLFKQTPETVTKTYQEILRETADSIRDKLRKQFA